MSALLPTKIIYEYFKLRHDIPLLHLIVIRASREEILHLYASVHVSLSKILLVAAVYNA